VWGRHDLEIFGGSGLDVIYESIVEDGVWIWSLSELLILILYQATATESSTYADGTPEKRSLTALAINHNTRCTKWIQ
jgi:hypothetical protein